VVAALHRSRRGQRDESTDDRHCGQADVGEPAETVIVVRPEEPADQDGGDNQEDGQCEVLESSPFRLQALISACIVG